MMKCESVYYVRMLSVLNDGTRQQKIAETENKHQN